MELATFPEMIAAIGALGLAAFALVDATKLLKSGGMSNSGFDVIQSAVLLFLPQTAPPMAGMSSTAKPLESAILHMLHAHWINGLPLGEQKAIAKSLIKLQLNPRNADRFATVTSVNTQALTEVARRMNNGEGLNDTLSNVLGRFDLALTALLDAAYQRADHRYRNRSKGWASCAAIGLALLGGCIVEFREGQPIAWQHLWSYVFCGVLAVPLAPISKDLTSAITAGVKAAQAIKR